MLKLLVIADDFTGALDTGVQFSNQGAKTLVSTEVNIDFESISESIEVLVLDTETRHQSFSEAYFRVRNIIEEARTQGIPYIYKKVDSALRGNLSAELKALIDHCHQSEIPFLPSYPEMNRVLVGGELYIDKILVSESVFALDPYEPVTESNVLKRLENEASIQSTLVQGETLPKERNPLLVFDSQSDETLKNQVVLLNEEGLLSVTVGCAGFAKVLSKHLFPDRQNQCYTLKKPIVMVCGSINPITQQQIEYVEARDYPRISLSGEQLLSLGYWNNLKGQEEIQNYLNLIDKHSLIMFETFSESTHKEINHLKKEKVLTYEECRFRISESLGKLTKLLWAHSFDNTFLFTGGDTLFQSMKVLDIKRIEPLTEIKPGVVLSNIEWDDQQIQVITKSGGFGSETLLEEILV
ncbi:four-carbon acid sugar kinase family protein [Staphylococcus shinii]|uniref:four-carbon acid sugar kinase family protein n=1 Tax=Staphylococcus shinii TaxID=2912228 RepID=UPI003F849E70